MGLSQAQICALEGGAGAQTSLETWVALGIALDRPIAIGFTRDVVEPLIDAGHLDAQECTARIAAAGGWRTRFEAADDPRSPSGSTDLRLDREGVIVLTEIWNRLDDLGAAARSSDRKLARAPAGTRVLWLLVDTAANHAIVRRYPGVLKARFPASSAAWVRAISTSIEPPAEAGLAWIDVRTGRLRELRIRDR